MSEFDYDRASLEAAKAFAARCIHVRPCACFRKMRARSFMALIELRDLGWTLTPPTRQVLAELANEALEWGMYDNPPTTQRDET